MNRTSTSVLAGLCLSAAPLSWAQDLPLPPQRTGLLYISGFSTGNVGEYLPDGTLLRTFTAPGLNQPRGVAVDDHGNVVVVSQGSGRLFVFDLAGNVVQEVPHADLTSGTGLSRSPSGDWYVGNFNPGRVLVFDSSWNHITTISVAGVSGVNCVSFDADGTFAVTDAFNAEVHRFDAAHNYLGAVQHSSLASPMSIALDSQGAHYVSNGGSTVVTKFDASWNFVATFGAGVLSAPQGIAIDEHDRLTISNFSAATVHRYDTSGALLGSFPLTGVSVGRNLAFQTSQYALAHVGTVDGANGYPDAVLTVNGQTGDRLGRLSLGASDPLTIELVAPPTGPAPAPVVLYGWRSAPSLDSIAELHAGTGLLVRPPPFQGGNPIPLVNSIGLEAVLGTGQLPAVLAPGTVLSLPGGVGFPMTLSLQGIISDQGSAGGTGYSVTNAVVLDIQ